MPLQTDEYVVVITYPKSLKTRCGEVWRWLSTCSGEVLRHAAHLFCRFCTCLVYFICWSLFTWFPVAIILTLSYCHMTPLFSLDSMSVLNLTLYQNSTIPPSQSPWQVDSSFNVALSAWNPNSVAGCYCSLRRVDVRVEYRGQLILQQEVGLGLGLKPGATRPVTMNVKGEGFRLQNTDLGPFMQNELRNGAMYFGISFATRYKRNDRGLGWSRMGCLVLAQAPNSTQVGGLLTENCVYNTF